MVATAKIIRTCQHLWDVPTKTGNPVVKTVGENPQKSN